MRDKENTARQRRRAGKHSLCRVAWCKDEIQRCPISNTFVVLCLPLYSPPSYPFYRTLSIVSPSHHILSIVSPNTHCLKVHRIYHILPQVGFAVVDSSGQSFSFPSRSTHRTHTHRWQRWWDNSYPNRLRNWLRTTHHHVPSRSRRSTIFIASSFLLDISDRAGSLLFPTISGNQRSVFSTGVNVTDSMRTSPNGLGLK
jgi:hypothetical protein